MDLDKAVADVVTGVHEKRELGAELARRIKSIVPPDEVRAALRSDDKLQALLDAVLRHSNP